MDFGKFKNSLEIPPKSTAIRRENESQTESASGEDVSSLAGRLLVASPHTNGEPFEQAVILVCAHSEEGAVGLMVNQPLEQMTLNEMLGQLDIPSDAIVWDRFIHSGGPVADSRGFVLYSGEENSHDALSVPGGLALSTNLDTLRAIGKGKGPKDYLVALGYAGWGSGQLEEEIRENTWLILPSERDLIFKMDRGTVWDTAMKRIGIHDVHRYSQDTGIA